MPVPITLIEEGGYPITATDFGTPMTPCDGVSDNQPLALPCTLVADGGEPVVLVNDDLSPYEAP